MTEPDRDTTPPETDHRTSDESTSADTAEAPRQEPADARVSDDVAGDDGDEELVSESRAEGPTDETVEEDSADEEDPLMAALRERDEYLDALRRKQAEFENFRKRMMREGASQRITGHAEVAERMLDVLDDFDRTLAAAGVDAQSQGREDVDPGFLKGVQLVHDKLAGVLADFGLTRVDESDVTFDPNRHEAVQQVAADDELDEPRVTQVLRPGYELGGRVLRAAMVVVEQ